MELNQSNNMKNKLERRSFLERLGLAVTTVFALPFSAFSQNNKKSDNQDMEQNNNPILRVKPLGFQWETADPFLFCVHHEDKFPKGNDVMGPAVSLKDRPLGDDFITKDGFRMYHGKAVPGFPGHPHRGFETITVVREGIVDHADSMGAAGRYGNGDVQWMTAGKGVQHSEMFPLIHKDKENPMELFQIWLNLPRKSKMVQPYFKMLWRESIPHYKHIDSQGLSTTVEVIAGKLADKKAPTPPPDSWAADLNNEVAVWNIKMKAGASWKIPKSKKGINRTLYYYQGEGLTLSGSKIPKYHAVEVNPELEIELISGPNGSSILLLQGKPIGEPVIQYGPFVMNTKEEINQAFEDFHKTKFGGWPWPKYDQVHDRSKSRFAKHAGGVEENKAM
jgi:redox-sensitive bicupin YhaK (pirin superfamily)